MNPNTDPAPSCQSCGTHWTEHPGITDTCAENQRLLNLIHAARIAYYDGGLSVAEVANNMFRILSGLPPLPKPAKPLAETPAK